MIQARDFSSSVSWSSKLPHMIPGEMREALTQQQWMPCGSGPRAPNSLTLTGIYYSPPSDGLLPGQSDLMTWQVWQNPPNKALFFSAWSPGVPRSGVPPLTEHRSTPRRWCFPQKVHNALLQVSWWNLGSGFVDLLLRCARNSTLHCTPPATASTTS